jgi:tripartite-type tricarboxylate transporter receptor subunit TctC
MRRTLIAAGAMLMSVGAASALAQGYPARPVAIVVPYIAGGAGDGVARVLASKLTESLGRSVYVDNRPGGGTRIGTEAVAKSAPNGHMLLMATNASAINAGLHTKLPYDLLRDFAPIVLIDISPNVLIVHPALPVRTVKDLIALARARPGQLNFGSTGIAGSVHFAGELFKWMAQVDIVHVPYKGFSQALTDLLNGQIAMSFSTMQSALPHVRAGRLKALAVTSARRSPKAPDLPTVSEAALPGYDMVTWHALIAPAGTPQEIIARLNVEVVRILKIPEVADGFDKLGVQIVASSPAELAAHMKAEVDRYANLVRVAGIRAE